MQIQIQRLTYLMKKFIIILIAFNILGLGQDYLVKAQTNPRVLFISSYSESFETVPEQIAGIHEALDPQGVILDIEYIDTKRFDTEENIRNFYASLQYKLENSLPYDALIVGDDRALDFALVYQGELFPKLPIVFLGINNMNRGEEAARDQYITGIIERLPIKENIELALKFNSNVNRVIGLVDNTITGIGEREQFYGAVGYYPSLHFEDLNIADYTYEEMEEVLQGIQGDTIVLYLGMTTDKEGGYKSIDEAAAFISANTKVPIYRPSIGGVGQGILGGIQISYHEFGKMAGEMVLQVLEGTPIASIHMLDKSPNYAIVDYQVLESFNLNENLLPTDTLFINKESSYFEQNMKLFMGVFAAVFVLLIISTLLGIDSYRYRSMQRKLKESNEELSSAYEELASAEGELRYNYNLIEANIKISAELNQKYEHALHSTNSVVWELNLENRSINFSENIKNLMNRTFKSTENIDWFMGNFLDAKTIALLNEEFAAFIVGEKSEINIEIPLKVNLFKQTKWIRLHGKSLQGGEEGKIILYGILTDVTERKLQLKYIDHLAHNDYLTNLPNRMSFMKKLQEEIKKGKPLYILLMDIDNFKEINDTLGHVWGDRVLRAVAEKLSDNACPDMVISRFGGDEFLLMLTNQGDCAIDECLENIRESFQQPIKIEENEFNIKFSIGITRYPEDDTDVDQLIMNADTALYEVKRSGKNHYLFYSKEMQQELLNKAVIEGIIYKAIQEEGFYLLYQPQVNVRTGEVESFEALARLKHHQIPPNVFIRIAEESDLICQIGRIVTKEAIRQAASWRDKGYPRKTISINFSSKQLRDKDYLEFLVDTLKDYDLDPQYIEIEITESILLEETDLTMELLVKIKELGIKIALDDFGTGFSSLNYLTYMPVDKVKLDKSLCDKFISPDNIKVIDSIISLAHSLNLVITAEGIEEQWQYEQLKTSGCNSIQGYLFSKPLPAEEAEKIYEKKYL